MIEICDGDGFSVPDISEEPNHCVPQNEETYEAEQVVCLGVVPIPSMECSGLLLFGTKTGVEYAERIDFDKPMKYTQDSESSSSLNEDYEDYEDDQISEEEEEDDFPEVQEIELDPFDEKYVSVMNSMKSLSSSSSSSITTEHIQWLGKTCQCLHQLNQQYNLHYSSLFSLLSLLATQIKEYAGTIKGSAYLADIESTSSFAKLLGVLRQLIVRAEMMSSTSSESRIAAQTVYRKNCKMIIERIQY